jgi:histidinol dehydrogenase
VQILTKEGLDSIGDIIETLATAEGLSAHAQSVRVRRQEKKGSRKNNLC